MLIQELCKDKGISLQSLAKKIGITYQTLWAASTGNPTLSTLERIAAALGVQVVDLFNRPAGSDADMVCPHCGKPIHVHLG